MTGIDIEQQDKDIEITYHPPYFKTMILVSIVSIILSIVFTRKVNSKQQT